MLRMPLILCLLLGLSRAQAQKLPYLGQMVPGNKPEIFAPNFISQPDLYEFGSVFNRSGTAFYFAVNVQGKEEIRASYLIGGSWTNPQTILVHPLYGFNDPFLSPDERRLYFISQRALDAKGPAKDYDIWYVEKQGDGWGEPINAGQQINTSGAEYYISFTEKGRMYFASNRQGGNFNIYYSDNKDGAFQRPVQLGETVNTPHYEADVFVDPKESYIIFCADRPDGYGRGDLYISFKTIHGGWSEAQNMGPEINGPGHELCPYVSPDGQYLFYTSQKDIYWVHTAILEDLLSKFPDASKTKPVPRKNSNNLD